MTTVYNSDRDRCDHDVHFADFCSYCRADHEQTIGYLPVIEHAGKVYVTGSLPQSTPEEARASVGDNECKVARLVIDL